MPKTYRFSSVEGLNKALRKLPKAAAKQLRDASVVIANREAGKAGALARSQGGVAAFVAPSIRGTRDRVPKILMGNAKRLPPRNGRGRSGNGQTIGDVIWGAEFGGGRRPTTQQFAPWRGSGHSAGYFLWPTVRADEKQTMDDYGDALIDAIDVAAKGAH